MEKFKAHVYDISNDTTLWLEYESEFEKKAPENWLDAHIEVQGYFKILYSKVPKYVITNRIIDL